MQNIRKNCFVREFKRANFAGMIVGAAILALTEMILWCVIGTPLDTFHYLRGKCHVPPVWLYMLTELVVHVLLGGACGMVLGDRWCFDQTPKYRGSFYFLLAVVFGYLFYAFFFGPEYFLVALLLAAMELFGLVICMLNYFRVIRVSAILVGVGCLWAFYRLCISVISFFVL